MSTAWARLRFGSHNVRGLGTAAAAADLDAAWRALGFDVVCIQETMWAQGSPACAAAIERLRGLGWAVYSSEAARCTAGVAVVVRADLLAENGGPVEVAAQAAPSPGAQGRLVSLHMDWRGHLLHVASVYLPAGDFAAQRAAMTQVLSPLAAAAAAAGRQCVWGGDYNFTPDPPRDRLRPAGALPSSGEASAARAWREHLGPHLADALRLRAPARRVFTHFSRVGAARLDRFYVSHDALPSVRRVAAAGLPRGAQPAAVRGCARSDHRPVMLDLVHRQPLVFTAPRPRVRLAFRASDPVAWQAFQAAVTALAGEAPGDDAALLEWWPGFKRRVASAAGRAARAARAAARPAATAAAADALAGLYAAAEAGDSAAAQQVAEAAAAARSAAAADEEAQRLRDRRSWVHHREYPHPGLTRQLRPPAARACIAALRTTGGRLVCTPPGMAAAAVRHWAGVSAAPAVDDAARAAVLAALDATAAPRLEESDQLVVANMDVTGTEVDSALRRMRGGTSPGPDGLPLELYRHCRPVLAPLLARLFSAAWAAGRLPRGFSEGLIVMLAKQGDATDPANYRPITLLGLDYRIFAKVLANRVASAVSAVIDREQTAFIPGRHIGENVMTLQLLPEALRAEGRGAFVAFCDFVKAYDTIDREFLYAVMQRLGFGGPFLVVVRLLLTRTFSRARVNGCLSEPCQLFAGVRQGCPLAPFLYLFIGQALLRWLKHRGLGIRLPGSFAPLTALQFADDTEVFLSSQHDVRVFLAAMHVFAAASGQRLHLGKTALLWVGARPTRPLPTHVAGLEVRASATALGFSFSDDGAVPARGWEGRLRGAEARSAAAARLGLSALGRGLACAAYATSTFLYHAEFADFGPQELAAAAAAAEAAVLGGGVRPPSAGAAAGAAPRGAALRVTDPRILVGSPSAGGWGLLPLREHVLARRAAWAARIPSAAAAGLPWGVLALAALQGFSGRGGELPSLPPPVRRLAAAVLELPRPAVHLPPDAACAAAAAAAPLPWLLDGRAGWGPAAPDGRALARAGVRTVGQLWRLLHAPPPLAAALAPVMPVLQRARDELPGGWLAAAEAGLPAAGAPAPGPCWAAAALQAARYPSGRDGRSLDISRAGVRRITAALVSAGGAVAARDRRLQEFALRACAGPAGGQPVAPPPDAAAVRRLFRMVWSLPLDNGAKEIFWVLVYGAAHSWVPCVCGAPQRGRDHFYWACPVAQAVVAEVQRCLPPSAGFVARAHFWLLHAPAGQFPQAWAVVALAALAAMESARRVQTRRARVQSGAAPMPVHALSCRAVAAFWARIAEFCALGLAPPAWRGAPCAFFTWVPDPADHGVGAWCVTRPS
jgi:exonuclease III